MQLLRSLSQHRLRTRTITPSRQWSSRIARRGRPRDLLFHSSGFLFPVGVGTIHYYGSVPSCQTRLTPATPIPSQRLHYERVFLAAPRPKGSPFLSIPYLFLHPRRPLDFRLPYLAILVLCETNQFLNSNYPSMPRIVVPSFYIVCSERDLLLLCQFIRLFLSWAEFGSFFGLNLSC